MGQNSNLALVAGAGAGLGQSLLQRFANEGMTPVGLGRTEPDHRIGSFHQVDFGDVKLAADLVNTLIETHGPPKIAVHNMAELVIAPFEDTETDAFQKCWVSMVQSLVVLGKSVLPAMARAGGGTLIVSGATASLRGGARFSAFASAKFALRGLTQSLAREYQPQGVHVVHVILDGIIDTPKSRALHGLDPAKMMDPADIADAYWALAQQPRSAWTHELDLRPATEGF